MDAVRSLRKIETDLDALGIQLDLLVQPTCNSYMEEYWTVAPPDPSLALAEDATHIVTPVGCTPLQKRMRLAAQDALAAGAVSEKLQGIAILRHADVNASDEATSLAFTRMVRMFFGGRRYRDICLGRGPFGTLFKSVQDWKIRRAEKCSQQVS